MSWRLDGLEARRAPVIRVTGGIVADVVGDPTGAESENCTFDISC